MNKDVIYIEPEDDITDIIAKLASSTEKVVAIVPQRKIGVLMSSINIKLIAKNAKAAGKAAVLVTDNASLMKFCQQAGLPVAANLKSRPAVPTDETIEAAEAGQSARTIAEEAEDTEISKEDAEIAEDFAKQPESAAEIFEEEAEKSAADDAATEIDSADIEDELAAAEIEKDPDTIELSDNDDEEEPEEEKSTADADKPEKADKKSDDKSAKNSDQDTPAKAKKSPRFSKKLRAMILAGAISLILIVCACVWAFTIAPAATIKVVVGTVSNNFSENVSFTEKLSDADPESGRFLLEPITHKETLTGDLVATEEKNIGNKATGTITASHTFSSSDSVTIKTGTDFVVNGLHFVTTESKTLSPDNCSVANLKAQKCAQSAEIKVTATEAGEKYNLEKGTKLNSKDFSATVVSLTGGSNQIVKVLSQEDLDHAVSTLGKMSETEAKEALKAELTGSAVLISSSFKSAAGDPKTEAKVGEELKENSQVTVEVTYTIYSVDQAAIEKYIRAKASLGSDQKIYDLGSPYVERFTIADGGAITGKLKTVFKSGPEVTPEGVLNKVKGRKIGEAQSLIKSINGVDTVSINPSYFWVNSIPDDANKITINIEVKE